MWCDSCDKKFSPSPPPSPPVQNVSPLAMCACGALACTDCRIECKCFNECNSSYVCINFICKLCQQKKNYIRCEHCQKSKICMSCDNAGRHSCKNCN